MKTMENESEKLTYDDINDAVANIIDRAIAERLELDPTRIAEGNPFLGDFLLRSCADEIDGDQDALFVGLCNHIDEEALVAGEVRLDDDGEDILRKWLDHNVFAHRVYEVWQVDNGVGFADGYTGEKDGKGVCLGICDTLDEVREIVGRAADETFREDGGKYDRIFDECAKARPEEEPEGFSEPEIECKKFVEAAERDLGFDAGDCKWVRVREMHVSADGTNRKFIGVL